MSSEAILHTFSQQLKATVDHYYEQVAIKQAVAQNQPATACL